MLLYQAPVLLKTLHMFLHKILTIPNINTNRSFLILQVRLKRLRQINILAKVVHMTQSRAWFPIRVSTSHSSPVFFPFWHAAFYFSQLPILLSHIYFLFFLTQKFKTEVSRFKISPIAFQVMVLTRNAEDVKGVRSLVTLQLW